MAEPEDLLGKANALMARHRPQGTAADPYAGIPVLEEVVETHADGDDLPLLTELVSSAPPDDERNQALAQSMRASLLAGLKPEIDALIEERLKEGLAPLVERLFDDMRGDLQLIARAVLTDAIHAVVEQELERRKKDG